MLFLLIAVVVVALLVAAGVVVVREVNRTTEVEAAPGYSVPEATAFVITRLPDATQRRMKRSEVVRLVTYCLGLLESAGVALGTRRPGGDELGEDDLVLDVAGLASAMRQGTSATTAGEDLEEVAAAFLEYLSNIGAVGEEAEPGDDQ